MWSITCPWPMRRPPRAFGSRYGALVIDSMPPATMTSALPVARMSCASIAAFIPEPHILFTVVQPLPSGSPAPSDAWRAGAWPWPAGSTQPMRTSWTSSAPILARSTAARIAAAPSSGAMKLFSSPWNAPIGVRAAETMTMGSDCMRRPLCGFCEELAADEPAPDLGSAGADLVELGVAPEAPGRRLVDVAHAAQRLDRLAGHPRRFFRRIQNGAGGILARGLAAIERLADGVYVGTASGEGRVHVGELALHQLEFADRLAELLALVHVGHDHVEAGGHDAERTAGEHGALVVEPRHEHGDAFIGLAEHVLGRHVAVAAHQLAGVRAAHAELVELLRGAESLHPFLDQKGGDALVARLAVNHQNGRVGPIGDPHLVAVQYVALAAGFCAQAHADHVRARARLGHRERAHMLARDELRQVFALLCIAAVPADLVDAQVGVRAVREPDRRRGARDLLHRDDVGEIAHRRAAVLFFHRHAEQAQRAELAPQVGREFIGAVDLRGARCDLLRGEIAHRVAQPGGGLAVIEAEEAHSG